MNGDSPDRRVPQAPGGRGSRREVSGLAASAHLAARIAFVEVDGRARAAIARRHHEVAGFAAGVLVATEPDLLPIVVGLLERVAAAVNNGVAIDVEALVDEMVMAPEITAPLVHAARR